MKGSQFLHGHGCGIPVELCLKRHTFQESPVFLQRPGKAKNSRLCQSFTRLVKKIQLQGDHDGWLVNSGQYFFKNIFSLTTRHSPLTTIS
jgi:hypothetical protein